MKLYKKKSSMNLESGKSVLDVQKNTDGLYSVSHLYAILPMNMIAITVSRISLQHLSNEF